MIQSIEIKAIEEIKNARGGLAIFYEVTALHY